MYLALDVWFTLLFKPRPDVLLVFFLCFCIQDSFTFFGFLHCSVFGSSHFDHLYFVYLSWFLFLQLLRCFSSLSSFSFEVSFFGDLRFLSSLLSFRFRFRPFINLPSLPSNILFYYFSLSLAASAFLLGNWPWGHWLFTFRSPLLGKSLLISFPSAT